MRGLYVGLCVCVYVSSLFFSIQTVMSFYHPCGNVTPVFLPQRSVLVMSGESRYHWKHGYINLSSLKSFHVFLTTGYPVGS